MPIYQCAAPVGLLTRDMKARIATAISGEIVVPFVAGEVNLVMQPGLSGRAFSRFCLHSLLTLTGSVGSVAGRQGFGTIRDWLP